MKGLCEVRAHAELKNMHLKILKSKINVIKQRRVWGLRGGIVEVEEKWPLTRPLDHSLRFSDLFQLLCLAQPSMLKTASHPSPLLTTSSDKTVAAFDG